MVLSILFVEVIQLLFRLLRSLETTISLSSTMRLCSTGAWIEVRFHVSIVLRHWFWLLGLFLRALSCGLLIFDEIFPVHWEELHENVVFLAEILRIDVDNNFLLLFNLGFEIFFLLRFVESRLWIYLLSLSFSKKMSVLCVLHIFNENCRILGSVIAIEDVCGDLVLTLIVLLISKIHCDFWFKLLFLLYWFEFFLKIIDIKVWIGFTGSQFLFCKLSGQLFVFISFNHFIIFVKV